MTAPTAHQSLRDGVAVTRAEVRDCIGPSIPLRRRWVDKLMAGPIARLEAEVARLTVERDAAVRRSEPRIRERGVTEPCNQSYVLIKRGLYWRPNSMGYTGVLDEAGRYNEAEAKAHADHCSGVTARLASEAPRFSDACWTETRVKVLQNDLTAAEARLATAEEENARLRSALNDTKAAADDMAQACIDESDSKGAGALQYISGFVSDQMFALAPKGKSDV